MNVGSEEIPEISRKKIEIEIRYKPRIKWNNTRTFNAENENSISWCNAMTVLLQVMGQI